MRRTERIALETSIPPSLRRDIEQGVYYCSERIVDGRVDRESGAWIEIDLEGEVPTDLLVGTVRSWVASTIASSLSYEDTTAREWGDPERSFRATTEEVIASPELRSMGEGIVAYGPGLTRAFRGIHALWEGLGADIGGEPLTLPAVATLEHMQRCDFLRQFPQMLSFVTHFREDFAVIDAFAEQCRRANDALDCVPAAADMGVFQKMLRPAICYHVYAYFEGASLAADPCLATASGDCFRYESRNTTGLDRLFDFRMYEIVALGTAEGVRRWRQSMIDAVVEIFESLDLPGRVKTSNDPFFVSGSVLKSTFQRAHDLKYELEIPFPNREGQLAVASFNEHQDFFGSRFDIRARDGTVANTGCTAFGLDRILAALLVHHGTDPAHWPSATKRRLGLS